MTKTDIFSAVDGYISGLFAKEDTALSAAVQAMSEAGLPEISVSPVLGKFLTMLAKLARARRILEIGTLGGYSTIWLGRALPEDGCLLTLEIDPLHARIARKNLARAMLFGTVEVREGPAQDLLTKLIAAGEEAFDLIFIDADKEAYLEYFDLSLKLSRPGTLIVADNVVRYGAVIDAHAGQSDSRVAGIQRFLDALAKHPGVDATIIQSVGIKGHDGLALAIVK
ncbi:MAG TPA: O-methyltransferase [Geobacterales bacterium]|nr:O-methyltransferase [Geobacterales bacterium]